MEYFEHFTVFAVGLVVGMAIVHSAWRRPD
jgi:hypothetical protein